MQIVFWNELSLLGFRHSFTSFASLLVTKQKLQILLLNKGFGPIRHIASNFINNLIYFIDDFKYIWKVLVIWENINPQGGYTALLFALHKHTLCLLMGCFICMKRGSEAPFPRPHPGGWLTAARVQPDSGMGGCEQSQRSRWLLHHRGPRSSTQFHLLLGSNFSDWHFFIFIYLMSESVLRWFMHRALMATTAALSLFLGKTLSLYSSRGVLRIY